MLHQCTCTRQNALLHTPPLLLTATAFGVTFAGAAFPNNFHASRPKAKSHHRVLFLFSFIVIITITIFFAYFILLLSFQLGNFADIVLQGVFICQGFKAIQDAGYNCLREEYSFFFFLSTIGDFLYCKKQTTHVPIF